MKTEDVGGLGLAWSEVSPEMRRKCQIAKGIMKGRYMDVNIGVISCTN